MSTNIYNDFEDDENEIRYWENVLGIGEEPMP